MARFFSFDSEVQEDEPGCLPEMTFKERLLACGTCFGLTIMIDLLSFGSMVGLVTGNPTRFALTYTFGNILSILGSGFLLGFKRQ